MRIQGERIVGKLLIPIAAMLTMVLGAPTWGSSAQAGAPPREQFVLTGLVYVEGGRGLAWLQEPTFTNNQIVTVRLGDRVGPYRLTKIMEDQVELEGPGGKLSVPLAGTGGAISVATSPGLATERTSSGTATESTSPRIATEATTHELPP